MPVGASMAAHLMDLFFLDLGHVFLLLDTGKPNPGGCRTISARFLEGGVGRAAFCLVIVSSGLKATLMALTTFQTRDGI
jgi:hypothetical protein